MRILSGDTFKTKQTFFNKISSTNTHKIYQIVQRIEEGVSKNKVLKSNCQKNIKKSKEGEKIVKDFQKNNQKREGYK